jgi:hypothetical protein
MTPAAKFFEFGKWLRSGDHTKIGVFVEIQKSAKIKTKCKISGHPLPGDAP